MQKNAIGIIYKMTANCLTLKEFLTTFIGKLNNAQIDHCVLRNYDELPDGNSGNDIDFLVNRCNVKNFIDILASIDGVAVTGSIDRFYVISVFVYGINNKENPWYNDLQEIRNNLAEIQRRNNYENIHNKLHKL